MGRFLESCWHTLGELAPWLFVGLVLAGLLHWLVPPALVRRRFRGRWGVVQAVALGIPLPLCSCSVIPAGLGLKRDGASNGAATGFLISTPQTGVDSFFVTASFFGWPFTLLKIGVAAATGLLGGWLVEWTEGKRMDPTFEPGVRVSDSSAGRCTLRDAFQHAVQILRSIWGWLLVGVVASASIEVVLPREWLETLGSLGLPATMGLVFLLSLPVYVCATASVPVAAGLVAAGLPPAAGFVFLFAGPASNLGTMGAIASQLGRRVLVIYLGMMILGGMLGGWAVAALGLGIPARAGAHVHAMPWWSSAAALALLAVFGWFLVHDLHRRLTRSSTHVALQPTWQVRVDGMTCGGCVEKLERALQRVPGVEHVEVRLVSGEARVSGPADRKAVAETVRSCGFRTPDDALPLVELTAGNG